MSSYRTEREDFIANATRHGLPLDVVRLLLREATGINRRAELACSSEAADRDRVKCPAMPDRYGKVKKGAPCLCAGQWIDHFPKGGGVAAKVYQHSDITRITLQDWYSERRIARALTRINDHILMSGAPINVKAPGFWRMLTSGDPRGYTLRVIPPEYTEENAGRSEHDQRSIGVPSGPSGLRW